MKKSLAILICSSMLSFTLPAVAQDSGSEVAPAPEGTKPTHSLSYTRKSPWLAGSLSIVPGLGQIYNEDYLVGGLVLGIETGLYIAAAAYAGLLDPSKQNSLSAESALLLALAAGIHLFCIFDATMEAVRRNETLDKWSLMYNPGDDGFSVAYSLRF